MAYVHLVDIQVKFQGRILHRMIAFFFFVHMYPPFFFIMLYVQRKNMHKENRPSIMSGGFLLYIFFELERDGQEGR